MIDRGERNPKSRESQDGSKWPFISIIIPTLNEGRYIRRCLDSVLASEYPRHRLEILLVDGSSTDGTPQIVEGYAARFPRFRVLNNPSRIVPVALNIGIRNSVGDIIIVMGAHAEYPCDYIPRLVESLAIYQADNVGGVLVTKAGGRGLIAQAIALALSHPVGVGNAFFRIGVREPRDVDTVPFGAFPKKVFEKVGLFDEMFVRNQDDEFNYRIRKAGGRIVLVPAIKCVYYARSSLGALFRQYYEYGYWRVAVLRKHRAVASWRQIVPAVFVITLGVASVWALISAAGRWALTGLLGVYAAVMGGAGVAEVVRHGVVGLVLPVALATLHVAYGLGFLHGLMGWLSPGPRRHILWRRRADDETS